MRVLLRGNESASSCNAGLGSENALQGGGCQRARAAGRGVHWGAGLRGEAQLLTVQTVTSRKNLRLSLVSSGIASTGCMVRSCAALGCVDFRLQRCIEQMHLIARYRGLWTHTGKDASTGLTV